MRLPIYSTLLSILYSFLAGHVTNIVTQALMDIESKQMPQDLCMILYFSFCYSLIINTLFFVIRRWDGCIEKLGGCTFTLLTYLTSSVHLAYLNTFSTSGHNTTIGHLLIVTFVQIGGIGCIATAFLRSKQYKPLKPGQKLTWKEQ